VEVIKSLGESLVDPMHLKEELPVRPNITYHAQEMNEAKERIHDKTVAYGILVRADRDCYGKLIEEIENEFIKEHDNYPKTPTEAYNLLENYRKYVIVKKRNTGQLDQVAFVTDGKKQKIDEDIMNIMKFPNKKCFKCGEFGHYKSNCPGEKKQINRVEESGGQNALMTVHVALAGVRIEINPLMILCDNESTVNIFKNKQMITNIRKLENPIRSKGIEGVVRIYSPCMSRHEGANISRGACLMH
jgi:hypothetical protein